MQRLESHMDLNSPKPGAFTITLQAATPSQIRKFPSPSVHLDPAAMLGFGQAVFSKAGRKPNLTAQDRAVITGHLTPGCAALSGMKQIFKGLCGSLAFSHSHGGKPLTVCLQTVSCMVAGAHRYAALCMDFLILFFPFVFFSIPFLLI